MKINRIYNEDCLKTMAKMPDNFIDLVVTSPPYDDLRTYNGYSFDFEKIAKELLRVLKEGAILVWVIGDQSRDWNLTLTPERQAIRFQEIGFKAAGRFIYKKDSNMPRQGWYGNQFELKYILLKGKRPKTVNLLTEKSNHAGKIYGGGRRSKDGSYKPRPRKPVNKVIARSNIWEYNTGFNKTTKDKIAFNHPAIFPEALAQDHILSWSNEGELVYDPFMGSGTTAKMAILNNRKWLGSEISKEYCEIANKRLDLYRNKLL